MYVTATWRVCISQGPKARVGREKRDGGRRHKHRSRYFFMDENQRSIHCWTTAQVLVLYFAHACNTYNMKQTSRDSIQSTA